ncbi:FRIGIDA-like protein 3, partial [Bienertia sinuspersici]
MSNSSVINAEESVANFMKTTATKRQKIRETLEAFHSQSNSQLLLAFQWKDLEEYFDGVSNSIAKREEEIEMKKQEVEWKQKYLNKKSSDIELKAKKVEESMKMADDRREEVDEACEFVVRLYGEVTEKEKLCEEELEVVRCKVERLRENKRDLKRKFERKELKLEVRELLIDNREEELETRRKRLNSHERELLERFQDVELREKKLEERVREFERRKKMFELKTEGKKVDNSVKVKNEPLDFDIDNDDNDNGDGALVDPSYADLKLNVTMDGIALQMFLNGRVNDHEVLRDEIVTGLGMSADPAKLVLDAMKGFYPDELRNECVGFDLNVVRKSCILLLEQLIKMKPRIKTHVRKRAMKIATEWKGKMNIDDAGYILEAVGFLQLVATYGLSSGFTKDDLSSLFESCAVYDGAPELCCNLGLTTQDVNGEFWFLVGWIDVPFKLSENCMQVFCLFCPDTSLCDSFKFVSLVADIVHNLLQRQQPFEALRLVYAFGLVNIFPPVPILKSHLMSSFNRAEEVNNSGNHSLELQIECIRVKLSALVSVVNCIQEYGLEPKYPVQPLEQLISELEMQQKSLISAYKGKSMGKFEELSTPHFPVSSSVKETNTSMLAFDSSIDESLAVYGELEPVLTDSLSAQMQGNPGNKCPRVDSVVVAKGLSGFEQSENPDWAVSKWPPVYYYSDQSW